MTDSKLLSVESHLAFGKNWIDYAHKIDEETIAHAVSDLQRLSGRRRFDSLSFLDIDWGSGLRASRRKLTAFLGAGYDEYSFVRPQAA